MRFKKGELTEESFDAIIGNIDSLEIQTSPDNEYFINRIKSDLKDIWGLHKKKGIMV